MLGESRTFPTNIVPVHGDLCAELSASMLACMHIFVDMHMLAPVYITRGDRFADTHIYKILQERPGPTADMSAAGPRY